MIFILALLFSLQVKKESPIAMASLRSASLPCVVLSLPCVFVVCCVVCVLSCACFYFFFLFILFSMLLAVIFCPSCLAVMRV